MSARDVLARNLAFLMEAFPSLGSQKLLFKTTGVTTSTVGRIKRAEVAATIDNIEALAKAFKISTAQLLDPRLPTLLGKEADKTAMSQAASIAADIQEAQFTAAQLQILANTVAALKSKP